MVTIMLLYFRTSIPYFFYYLFSLHLFFFHHPPPPSPVGQINCLPSSLLFHINLSQGNIQNWWYLEFSSQPVPVTANIQWCLMTVHCITHCCSIQRVLRGKFYTSKIPALKILDIAFVQELQQHHTPWLFCFISAVYILIFKHVHSTGVEGIVFVINSRPLQMLWGC